jgi:hypothetical protein
VYYLFPLAIYSGSKFIGSSESFLSFLTPVFRCRLCTGEDVQEPGRLKSRVCNYSVGCVVAVIC